MKTLTDFRKTVETGVDPRLFAEERRMLISQRWFKLSIL